MLPQGGASRSAGVVPTSYELRAAPHTGDMGSPRRYDEEAVQVSPSTSLRMPTCPHAELLRAPCLCSAPPRMLPDTVRSSHSASLGSSDPRILAWMASWHDRATEKLPCTFGRQSGLLSSGARTACTARAAFRDHQSERERHAHSLRRFRAACGARSRDRPCQPCSSLRAPCFLAHSRTRMQQRAGTLCAEEWVHTAIPASRLGCRLGHAEHRAQTSEAGREARSDASDASPRPGRRAPCPPPSPVTYTPPRHEAFAPQLLACSASSARNMHNEVAVRLVTALARDRDARVA